MEQLPLDIDLNLFVALDALLTEGSVTGAARRLHLTTPAMSRTLGRIRRALHDPILVRSGRSLVPTAFASGIQPRVRAFVRQAWDLTTEPRPLDLAALERTFTILLNDAMALLLAAPIVDRVRAVAPGVRLQLIPEGPENLITLRDPVLDLELGVVSDPPAEVVVEVLISDRLVGVVRADHPLARGRVTPARFARGTHLSVSRRGRFEGPVDAMLAELGLSRRVVVTAPTTGVALDLVANSDLVGMVIPTILGSGRYPDLVGFRLPFDLPVLDLSMAWHPRNDTDPAHAWLWSVVLDVVGALPPTGRSARG